jgi:hypothetical protein
MKCCIPVSLAQLVETLCYICRGRVRTPNTISLYKYQIKDYVYSLLFGIEDISRKHNMGILVGVDISSNFTTIKVILYDKLTITLQKSSLLDSGIVNQIGSKLILKSNRFDQQIRKSKRLN